MNLGELLAALGSVEPGMFSPRGAANVSALGGHIFRTGEIRETPALFSWKYEEDDEIGGFREVRIEKRSTLGALERRDFGKMHFSLPFL